MHRPQYFNATPKGYVDVPFVQPVTYGQDMAGGIPPGQFLNDYVIQLDNDADQLYRSLFWQGAQQGQSAGPASGSIQIRLRNSYGLFLTDGYIPIWLLCWGAGSTSPDGGSGRCKVFEPELYCPKGSVLIVDYFNPDGGTYQYPGLYEFRGVKRNPIC